jgi:hypothetical protein
MRQDLLNVFAVPRICPAAKITQVFIYFADNVCEKGAFGEESDMRVNTVLVH